MSGLLFREQIIHGYSVENRCRSPEGATSVHGKRALWKIWKRGNILNAYASAAVAAALLMASGPAATAQTAGDWVLGNYRNAGYWFPGVVEKAQGGRITIRYDDGDRETVDLADVRPYNWMIGMKVQCNFRGRGDWYDGTIASLAGEKIGIAYDDGDKETTKTGRCRSR
jgi:hypothetical protein